MLHELAVGAGTRTCLSEHSGSKVCRLQPSQRVMNSVRPRGGIALPDMVLDRQGLADVEEFGTQVGWVG